MTHIKEVVNMKTVQISLNSIDKVKSFVNDITKFDYDFDLVSGRYVIDYANILAFYNMNKHFSQKYVSRYIISSIYG